MYCKNCGNQAPDNARFCQSCGAPLAQTPAQVSRPVAAPAKAQANKPIIIIIIAIALVGFMILFSGIMAVVSPSSSTAKSGEENTAASSSTVEQTSESITYTHYDVVTLFDELEQNALRAEQTHQNEYVEIEGYIHNFDSDGKYISVGAREGDYDHYFDTIVCDFTTDDQREQALEMNKYDKVTIRGQITSIGEIMGYCLDIDEIVQ